jgi:hypothetical protein
MGVKISLADVHRLGVRITAEEGVAIVQRLLRDHGDATPEPPFGPLSLATLRLTEDGGVECACDATPAVAEAAILLQSMLAATPHVPGGLRYAIARALHEVDAPPFDSVTDFSLTLARYEPADGELTIRRVVERANAIRAGGGVRIERRHMVRSPDDLRRQLRDADRRFYESRIAPAAPEPPRRRVWVAGAALLAVIAAVGAGDAMRGRASPLPPVPPPPVIQTPVSLSPIDHDQIEPIIATVLQPARGPRAAHSVRASASRRRSAHAARLRWLRRIFVWREDLGSR